MRTLLEMDLHNYKKNGTVGQRPSVRGIIFCGGKVALVHSLKFDYYKFPGGGIESGEKHEQALSREVMEETGLQIIPGSEKEYGKIIRKEKGLFDDIFIQENFYYLCRVTGKCYSQKLDDYEADEKFTLEWVTLDHAVEVNETHPHGEKTDDLNGKRMIERETFVMKKLLLENETYSKERAVCLVLRGEKILMEHMCYDHDFFDLPGGGIQKGETAEEAAVRELKEECGLDGRIIKKLGIIFHEAGYYDAEHCFLLEVDDDAVEITGTDPELPPDRQMIKHVEWKTLEEIPERDRAWLFWRGLLNVPSFSEKVLNWKNEISIPGMK